MLIKGERGVALVLALAVIALLVSLVVDFSYTMMVDLTLAANLRDEQKAFFVARSGVELAKHLLQKDQKDNLNYVGLDEDWAHLNEHPGFLSEDDEGKFKVTIEDEAGKIPINELIGKDTTGKPTVNKDILIPLERLFEVLELDPQLIDPIIDWLDPDNTLTTSSGAKDAYYQSLPSPYHCKNGPLDSLDELLLVKGMTKEILYGTEEKKGLIHFLTLYSAYSPGKGKINININTTSAEVLQSLSVSEAIIDKVCAQALVDYLQEKPFTDKEGIDCNVIGTLPGCLAANVCSRIKDQCDIKSSYFSLRVEGQVRDIKKVIYTVLKREEKKGVKPVFWRVE
jgi:general secretion pathway protein K